MVVPGQIATSSTILIIVIIIDITFIVVIIITEYHHHHCHRHHHLEFPLSAVVSLKLVFGHIFCAPTLCIVTFVLSLMFSFLIKSSSVNDCWPNAVIKSLNVEYLRRQEIFHS